ncbi:MAG TPA: division/cell wall cluster transcriptional repressor MraZ [Bacilli bacterium]|nr:division/cell wall cluster transcriptional repressor MraZ [Bacilli bacterium]
MLMGEYHHSIDDKSRLVLPSKFRDGLGSTFIITRGLEGCLFVYPIKEWDLIINNLKELPFTKKDHRAFMRFFLSGAEELSFDKQGRILIPNQLLSYANLTNKCVVIGVNDRLEIWAEDKFTEFFNENNNNIIDIAEKLFDENHA